METGRLEIELYESSLVCNILVEEGLIRRINSVVRGFFREPSSIAIIADSNTAPIFGTPVRRELSSNGIPTHLFTFKAGERSKSLRTVEYLAARMDENKIDRSSLLLAIGGGVVGDVSGFLASIYKRGIPYFQIPTTLLAQVDSSIGGKTGVDSSRGKNQLGTFYQPRAVLVDPECLDGLPQKEIINGLAEISKSAIIADREMFDELCRVDLSNIRDIKRFIYRTCAIKARIVARDEKESNLRSILNYGHTVGHAIEATSQYELNHGTSVILGMIAEGWIASKLGYLRKEEYQRQVDLLQKILATSSVKAKTIRHVLKNRKVLSDLAYSDKKSTHGKIKMCLPNRIGGIVARKGEYRLVIPERVFLESITYLDSKLSS